MKEIFRLPGWQGSATSRCCWRCTATQTTRKDCSLTAHWRNERLTHFELLNQWRLAEVTPSPIVGAPFFSTKLFQLDWLHVMDLGVTCDFLGNLFLMLLAYCDGGSRKEKVKTLYRRIRQYYVTERIGSRLDTLTEKMLLKRGGHAKLRARGAEARGLVGFARQQAVAHLNNDIPSEAAAKTAAIHLSECYANLSRERFHHAAMKEHSRKFCIQMVALEAVAAHGWRAKPKLHLMQELCEESADCPSINWTYRDEDFGGSMAGFARVRGGTVTSSTVGRNVLHRFRARHLLPVW